MYLAFNITEPNQRTECWIDNCIDCNSIHMTFMYSFLFFRHWMQTVLQTSTMSCLVQTVKISRSQTWMVSQTSRSTEPLISRLGQLTTCFWPLQMARTVTLQVPVPPSSSLLLWVLDITCYWVNYISQRRSWYQKAIQRIMVSCFNALLDIIDLLKKDS